LTAEIMDGRSVASLIKEEVKEEVEALKDRGIEPCLAAVLVGEDPGSQRYVAMKRRDCKEVGIDSLLYELPEGTGEVKLLDLIDRLNVDRRVHGILVQSPLPRGIDEARVFEKMSPKKDVDGLHPYNVGRLMTGSYSFESSLLPCTPRGIMALLDHYGVEVSERLAVIVNRSALVGKPLSKMLLDRDATVTICHSRTLDIGRHTRMADTLITAVGRRFAAEKSFLVDGEMVKEGAVVVDVANNYLGSRVYGDVDFDGVRDKASFITPVPGGVGPVTRAMLLKNTLIAAMNP
jgi:methylenetetrahydrofolate dehydrogenase (NADP+)/methenyltetrahydrofolate cyclohydrolase